MIFVSATSAVFSKQIKIRTGQLASVITVTAIQRKVLTDTQVKEKEIAAYTYCLSSDFLETAVNTNNAAKIMARH